MNEQEFTINETAERLGITYHRVRGAIERGELRAHKRGRYFYMTDAAIKEYGRPDSYVSARFYVKHDESTGQKHVFDRVTGKYAQEHNMRDRLRLLQTEMAVIVTELDSVDTRNES